MLDYIASRYDQFIKDLETIVNIDSGSRYAPGVSKIAAFFHKRFENLQWYTRALAFADGDVPCLEASNVDPSGTDVEFDFLFLGHMDLDLDSITPTVQLVCEVCKAAAEGNLV